MWQLYDELGQLPPDAFGERTSLGAELDALTVQLRAAAGDEVISKKWADAAGRKTSGASRPHIPSPSEGGGAPE